MLQFLSLSRQFPVIYRHSTVAPNLPAKLTFRAMATETSPKSFQASADTADIEILDSLVALRSWRQRARDQNKKVGFVPTMGALHDGHLDLVRESLRKNPLTVVSIFVNPAQFAPHEDLATYPRTLDSDLMRLREVSVELTQSNGWEEAGNSSYLNAIAELRKPPAVFIPPVKDMYPSGITTNVAEQRGAFVQVKGLEEQMEGKSRPGFFRGVATVVLKLFNAVEPNNAYFGQKDIQQALLLRHLTSDLLLSHPSPQNLHIVPTHRDPSSGLALSSRNMYLNEKEKMWAPTLWKALQIGKKTWESELGEHSGLLQGVREKVTSTAMEAVHGATVEAQKEGVTARLDYIQLNWADTLEPVGDFERNSVNAGGPGLEAVGRAVILSGAMWVGKTRLIDNMILGHEDVVRQIIS